MEPKRLACARTRHSAGFFRSPKQSFRGRVARASARSVNQLAVKELYLIVVNFGDTAG